MAHAECFKLQADYTAFASTARRKAASYCRFRICLW
jgi:hypothetical protein